MNQAKTQGNASETPGNDPALAEIGALRDTLIDGLETIGKQLDHVDAYVHEVHQKIAGIEAFIDEHRAALTRGLSLLDTGSVLTGWLGKGGKRRAVPQDPAQPVQEP